MSRALKEFIYRYLYFVISNSGENLPTLFNAHPKQKLSNPELTVFPDSLEEAVDIDKITSQQTIPFYKIDESRIGDVHKHTGRNCGRKFKIGNPCIGVMSVVAMILVCFVFIVLIQKIM